MRNAARRTALVMAIAGLALVPDAGAGTGSDRALTWTARCPIDVIFPLRVNAARAHDLDLVPDRYDLVTGPDGRALMVVSLLYCDDSTIDGVAAGPAVYSDLLFQIAPPFGTATIPPDHNLDGYWSWLLTDHRRLHERLGRLGMHTGFDPRMRVEGAWTETLLGTRLTSVSGRVTWPGAAFKLSGTILDTSVPEGSDMRFWQDVRGGALRSRLTREPGAEEGSAAHYTLTTRADSRIAAVLGRQCAPLEANERKCRVSGPGAVTHIVGEFAHDIEVRPAADW